MHKTRHVCTCPIVIEKCVELGLDVYACMNAIRFRLKPDDFMWALIELNKIPYQLIKFDDLQFLCRQLIGATDNVHLFHFLSVSLLISHSYFFFIIKSHCEC